MQGRSLIKLQDRLKVQQWCCLKYPKLIASSLSVRSNELSMAETGDGALWVVKYLLTEAKDTRFDLRNIMVRNLKFEDNCNRVSRLHDLLEL